MGHRKFLVKGDWYLEFFKHDGGMEKVYIIDETIPDDAKIVATEWRADDGVLVFVLESDEWSGDSDKPLAYPMVTMFTRKGLSDHLRELYRAEIT